MPGIVTELEKTKMKLYFIRHGQTEWNIKGKIQGSYDSDLNQNGIMQAEELGCELVQSEYKFSKIYSSKQKRAMQTAEILSKATCIEFEPIEGIEEMNLGEWEGLTWQEVQERFPEEYTAWCHDRRNTKTPKGESYQEVLERVLRAIRKIIQEHQEDVAIVTHGAVIMCLQCYVTQTSFNELRKFEVKNCMVTPLEGVLFRENI